MAGSENREMKFDRQELFRTIGWLGAAMAVAGGIRYSIQGELLLTSKILLIGGGVLLLAGIVFNYRAIAQFFSRRSSKLGTNTIILAVAVLAILGFLNFLGFRHHKRFDLTTEKLYTLSDQTERIVRGLQKDVSVIRFAKTPDQALNDQMAEYVNLSRHMHYQQVDPQEKPEIAKQYGVTRMGQVVAASGSKNEKIDETGEQDITNAILKVTHDKVQTVCFVTGHGEKSITATDGHGYSAANDQLKKESYQTKEVNLVSEGSVPSDCDVLVEAGPAQPLFPQEGEMIKKYLDGGGKALILVDPDTDPKLDDVFQAWNISVGKNFVIDASGVGRLFGTGPEIPLVVDYGTSPITRSFQQTMTFFPLARTVSVADKSKPQPDDVELLKTSPRSFTKPKLVNGEIRFDPKQDTAGPLSLGVAAERKADEKSATKDARLVVIGDSDFASNQAVNYARNGDLFYNTINWLSSEENLISIRPKNPANRRVNLTESQQRTLFWFSLLMLPGIVIISGIYIWWKRR